jgi:hypothetical protein
MVLAALAVAVVVATLVVTYAAIRHGLAKSEQAGEHQPRPQRS